MNTNFDAINFLHVIKAVSVTSSGLFAGAAIYITYVQHPALMTASPREMVNQFQVFYPRAAKLQATLALTAMVGSAGAAYLTERQIYIIPSVLFATVVGYTLLSIKKINTRLLTMKKEDPSPNVQQLIKTWGRKHFVRSVLSSVGFGVLIYDVFRR
ncbi:hypothetical protein K7432_012894 [Basidiobolus ranarum]|uniref:DUF1772 domain-containing protein n=1 Tax=Basidiobolus ranarum TaxID=34480 RepID=A0ABR2WK32_9FUNG